MPPLTDINPLRAALDLVRSFVDGLAEGVRRDEPNPTAVLLHALWESADDAGAKLLVMVNGVRYEREDAPIALDDMDWLHISRMAGPTETSFWFTWEGAAGMARPHLNALGIQIAGELRRAR